jgi:cobalt-zinc-cadmium efflux system membrane fusion protein
MKRKQALLGVLAAVIVVSLAAWLLTNRKPDPAAGRAEAAVEPSINGARNSLRYPEGAPQLTMIESRAIPSSPVPLADALSARVVYDEDATARIGVPISGRILTLKAAPGELVKAGQVLAEIDSPDVGTAYADLNKAHADEGRKRLILERAKDLAPGEGIAAKDLEAAQADYAQARAETARTELRLKNLNPRGLAVQGQRVVSPVR